MPLSRAVFELCAPSLQAAIAADHGGADRIELCSNLPVGGVTPDDSLLDAVIQAISIPVHVLIRPRPGNFIFSDEEFALMGRQILTAKAMGASGVAIGVLLSSGRVDVERTRELAALARPMSVTFHRGFDVAADLDEALESVVETGADVLLTSGGAADVWSGAESIARLRRQAGTRIEIMAGGGLRLGNISEIVHRTGVSCLHGSMTPPRSMKGKVSSRDRHEESIREAVRLFREAYAGRPVHASAD